MVRRFTEQEITPYAGAWDETQRFPREIYHKLAELGLMGMTTPEEYGGGAASPPPPALVFLENGRRGRGPARCVFFHKIGTGPAFRFWHPLHGQRTGARLASIELLRG